MRREIEIRTRTIGEGYPLFIIAEIGITCNYNMEIAKDLIDLVHNAGAFASVLSPTVWN